MEILKANNADLSDILRVQKAAFAPVAKAHGKPDIPPMTETQEQAEEELGRLTFFKCVMDGRIMGAVRAGIMENGECYIGRLVVLPDHQRRGIGAALMHAAHSAFSGCTAFKLFTGKDDTETIAFYTKLSYTIISTENVGGLEIVNMRRENKQITEPTI